MKKREGLGLVALGLLLFTLGAGHAVASTTYYGCLRCRNITPTGMGATCQGVGPLEGGDGWICHEDNTLPWPDGPSCWVAGGLCTNGGDGGGLGGGGLGSGGSACQTSGFCPAECFSCRGGGRPAI